MSAVVTEMTAKIVKAELASGEAIQISGDGLRFAANALQGKAGRDLKLRPGALIRVMQDNKEHWSITQLPEVDAAYVSLNAHDGSYRALIGGFDFNRKKFGYSGKTVGFFPSILPN